MQAPKVSAPRKKFVVTTTGITVEPKFKSPKESIPVIAESDAPKFFDVLVKASKAGIAAIVMSHQQVASRFIAAVANGIGKKPEDLVVDYHKDFVTLLERWAANDKARYTITPNIRIGGKILLGAGGESSDETTEDPSLTTPDPKPKPTFQPRVDVTPLYSVTDDEVLQPGEFADRFRKIHVDVSADEVFLNYLRYIVSRSKDGDTENDLIIQNIGIMRFDFSTIAFKAPLNPDTKLQNFSDFFLASGVRYAIPEQQPATVDPQPSSTLLDVVDQLFAESESAVQASNLVEFYKYSVIPERYSNLLFGPDLIYGIGQAMQRLREKYKFTRTNDELFVDFINDEHWRDLFVSLVVGVITLQKKISSFSTPQNVVRMIENNVELTVMKFSSFTKFHRQAPPKRSFNF